MRIGNENFEISFAVPLLNEVYVANGEALKRNFMKNMRKFNVLCAVLYNPQGQFKFIILDELLRCLAIESAEAIINFARICNEAQIFMPFFVGDQHIYANPNGGELINEIPFDIEKHNSFHHLVSMLDDRS